MHFGQFNRAMKSAAGARAIAFVAASLAFFSSPAKAVEAPFDHCRAVSKIEYDSAKKQFLLRNRFGAYIRTGRIWRRHYWYCQQ
jgi:hypothetical protein